MFEVQDALQIVSNIPLFMWLMAFIGGLIFAGVFNIPARKKFLSRESDTRNMAIRYDSLNFLTFYITFITPLSLVWWANTGDESVWIILTAMFVTYSLAFWIVLKTYIHWNDT